MKKQPPIIPGALEYRVEIHEGVRKSFQDIFCSMPDCPSIMSTAVSGDFKPASVIMNIAKKRGWKISGNHYKNRICPLHTQVEPKEEEETTVATQLTKSKDDTTVPSEAARAKRRAVFFEIDSAYENKSYKAGFSDAVIADKCKVSLNMVQMIREENFGPAGHSPEVTEIRNMIAGLTKRIDAIETKAIDHLTLVETTAKNLRSDLGILEAKLKNLESLL